MEALRFKASGQRLSRVGPPTWPVAGSEGYLRCEFDLDGEWDGLRAAARFFAEDGAEHAALIEGRACMVPDAVTRGRWFKVALMGAGDGRTVTTNAVTVMQEVV